MTVPHDLTAALPPCQCAEGCPCLLHRPPAPRVPAGHELGAENAPVEIRFWHLLCNNVGPGRLVGYAEAAWQASRDGVTGSLTTGLSWRAGSTQDPRLPVRDFTLTPLTEQQALEWIRANHHVTAC